MLRRTLAIVAATGLTLSLAGGAAARNINAENSYTLTNLVSDQPDVADAAGRYR